MSAFHEGALTAAAIFLLLAAAYRASRHPKNTRPVTESTQPVTGRATTHCAQRACPGEGLFSVMAEGDTQRRLVCWSCLREGWQKEWWISMHNTTAPYDHVAAEHFEAWERELSGGAA
jgi:hypothetical protein